MWGIVIPGLMGISFDGYFNPFFSKLLYSTSSLAPLGIFCTRVRHDFVRLVLWILYSLYLLFMLNLTMWYWN